MPQLRVAVAGLNSTMVVSHRPEDHYGWIGEAQAAWFAKQLRPFEDSGWLRVGIVRHDPRPRWWAGQLRPHPPAGRGHARSVAGPRLNLLLHGPGSGGSIIDVLASGLPVVPAAASGREEIIEVTVCGMVLRGDQTA